MIFSYALFSEQGPRPANEDAVGAWVFGDDLLALAIADGLGGALGGQRASHIAIEVFGTFLESPQEASLFEAALEIHRAIRAEQLQIPQFREMATTFSAVILNGKNLRGVHCGDTRVVLARGQGIRRLTSDHTEAERLLMAGKLTREEFRSYPRKNILDSALGVKAEPHIDTFEFNIERGDRILLSSDGVHEKVPLRELQAMAQAANTPDELASSVERAVRQRNPSDNYSLVCALAS